MVTGVDASAILAEQKVISANLTWTSYMGRYKLEATVYGLQSKKLLRLCANVGTKNRGFVLLFNNLPIRKYTVHSRHIDASSRRVVTGPHKHSWDDTWEDKLVYIPQDIRSGDPNDELIDFLKECNIELRGAYQRQSFFRSAS